MNDRRILLFSTTTGYQARSFGEAARKLGVELVSARDHCCSLEDPWGDHALSVHFHDDDESLNAIVEFARRSPVAGVIAVGDQPTLLAARTASALGLPFHPIDSARRARSKLATRECLREAGLPVPEFTCVESRADPRDIARTTSFPCVVKPIALSGSRGVIRADDEASFVRAFERVRAILASPDLRVQRNPLYDLVLVESYIDGPEFAIEGLMTHGEFRALAVFDKPDPLEGPFFEETIYVTPTALPEVANERVVDGVRQAVRALGLSHGPVHAECRVNGDSVFVLEAAARPIGGLCARALTFEPGDDGPVPFEEVLLRHALGEHVDRWHLRPGSSGVMMIPIPADGVYRGVRGVEEAGAVGGIDDLLITAKPDQSFVRLPEGASYLGFIFASGNDGATVTAALRDAHRKLTFSFDRPVPVRPG